MFLLPELVVYMAAYSLFRLPSRANQDTLFSARRIAGGVVLELQLG